MNRVQSPSKSVSALVYTVRKKVQDHFPVIPTFTQVIPTFTQVFRNMPKCPPPKHEETSYKTSTSTSSPTLHPSQAAQHIIRQVLNQALEAKALLRQVHGF